MQREVRSERRAKKDSSSGNSAKDGLPSVRLSALSAAAQEQRDPHRFERGAGEGGGREANAASQGPHLLRPIRDARSWLRHRGIGRNEIRPHRHAKSSSGDYGGRRL